MAKKQKPLILYQESTTQTASERINDLLIKVTDQLLDENKRLKNSLDMERKRQEMVFGGTQNSRRK